MNPLSCLLYPMANQVSLFRAINVAGSNVITMLKLQQSAQELGFSNIGTILQSGNLVYKDTDQSTDEDTLEAYFASNHSIQTSIMNRTADEFHAMIEANPFAAMAASDPSHLVVMFLKTAPEYSAESSLKAAIVGREEVHLSGKHLYATYADGIGRSKLTNKVIEKHLGTMGTARNWNTVLKISALLNSNPAPASQEVSVAAGKKALQRDVTDPVPGVSEPAKKRRKK